MTTYRFSGTIEVTEEGGSTPIPPLEGGGGGGSGLEVPTFDYMRTTSAQNDDIFKLKSGDTSLSNDLVAVGKSAYPGSEVRLYLNGEPLVSDAANDSGGWVFVLGEQDDGDYTLETTVVVNGEESARSQPFKVTIAPLLGRVTVGQGLRSGSLFDLGPDEYEVQNDNTNSAACVVVDGHTLHFTLKPQDNWNNYNRTEVASHKNFKDGDTIHITYKFMLDPAHPAFGETATCTQIHANNDGSIAKLPCLMQRQFYNNRNDSPTWANDKGDGNQNWYDHTPITRGAWHTEEIIVKSGKPGIFKLWLDGQLIRDETVIFGSQAKPPTPASPYYWKFGVYRGNAGGHNETNAVIYRNMLVKYS
jgi:hypothetical protein